MLQYKLFCALCLCARCHVFSWLQKWRQCTKFKILTSKSTANQAFLAVANVTFLIFFVRCKRAVHDTGCFKKWNLLWILCGTKYQIREFSIRVSLLNFRDLLKVTLLLRLHNIQFFKFWSWGALIPISCAKNSAIVVWFCQNEMFGLESLCKAPGVYCDRGRRSRTSKKSLVIVLVFKLKYQRWQLITRFYTWHIFFKAKKYSTGILISVKIGPKVYRNSNAKNVSPPCSQHMFAITGNWPARHQ